jgi:hypothetical protein
MRVLICGDRHWDDFRKIRKSLLKLKEEFGVDLVIEGGQKETPQSSWGDDSYLGPYGADYHGKIAAWELGIPVMEFAANWDLYQKAAGPIRNGWMLKFGLPDLVLAFHSDLEHSKGTKNMVEQAKKKGIEVKVIK